ncbi:MAG: prolipoprotein diacylglyceryl transferase [Chloroflexota bacterium]|nr:prolipoprotein diacylglyceryl transferase [Chloroflexota bacterium]
MPINLSIDPLIAQVGPFQLGWHGIFSALALVVGVWIGLRSAARLGLPLDPLVTGIAWAIAGGVVGARLFHVLDHLPHYADNPLEAFAIWQGGIAVYGGFVGGVLAGVVAARALGLPVGPALDAAGSGMLIGQAIGRVGCFINGDAWGGPTGGPWGVVYRDEDALLPPELLGVPTHPYPLYEIAGVAIVLGLVWLAVRRGSRPGTTFLLAAIGYAAVRFALTFVRQEPIVALGLQEAQLVALFTGAAALAILVARALSHRAQVAGRRL